MQIQEVLRRTGLTRKAVEYYAAQGLIAPRAMDNGYREFSEEDAARLSQIAAYRKLGVGVAQIREILAGDAKKTLNGLLVQRTLCARREEQKCTLLARLAAGEPLAAMEAQLRALDAQESIAARLMEAFPGYFGPYFGLHFAHFLTGPIETDDQQAAYGEIVRWLDALPPLDLPDDLCAFLEETEQEIGATQMGGMHEAVLAASENPQAYLEEHADAIRAYAAIRETQAYKASPAARLMEYMKEFQRQVGYAEVFLPAMERLSPAYAAYRRRLEAADAAFAAAMK